MLGELQATLVAGTAGEHPFSDGNGRIGRLLVIVQLLRGAVIREPLLVVSPWFEARRERYQDALLRLSGDGQWDTWIAFFAEGVAAAAVESQAKVEKLLALQDELRARVQRANKRGPRNVWPPISSADRSSPSQMYSAPDVLRVLVA